VYEATAFPLIRFTNWSSIDLREPSSFTIEITSILFSGALTVIDEFGSCQLFTICVEGLQESNPLAIKVVIK
jgi:hypothetical protein